MVFEALKEQFVAFSDSQRLERLKECQDLQILLNACLQRRQQEDPTSPKPTTVSTTKPHGAIDLEDVPTGFKMMRYFEWRTKELVRVKDTDGSTHILAMPSAEEQQQQPHLMTCAREAHALWGCRAVTLACAPDLNHLKQCFDTQGKMAVLSHSETAYERNPNANSTANITNLPCLAQQQRMGSCVTTKAAELQERVRQRQQTEAEKASEDV
jgi:hypothetical protein